jgi:hypothetical protein
MLERQDMLKLPGWSLKVICIESHQTSSFQKVSRVSIRAHLEKQEG